MFLGWRRLKVADVSLGNIRVLVQSGLGYLQQFIQKLDTKVISEIKHGRYSQLEHWSLRNYGNQYINIEGIST